jgi:hypothetical protein
MTQAKKSRTAKVPAKKPRKVKTSTRKSASKKQLTLTHKILVAAKLKRPARSKLGASAGFIAVPKSKSSRVVLAAIIIAFAGTATYFTFFSSAAVVTLAKVEAEKMTIPTTANKSPNSVTLWNNATLNGSFTTTAAADKITIRAKGDQCAGAPQMVLKVNGQQLYSVAVTATSYTDYTTAVSLPAATHSIELSFTNDHWLAGNCDRNLYIDRTTVYGTTTPTPAPSVSLSANPTSVTSGATSTLTWSSTNATSCTASGAWSGTKATSGSAATAALTANSTYSLSCTGAGGTTNVSANVTVTQSSGSAISPAPVTGWWSSSFENGSQEPTEWSTWFPSSAYGEWGQGKENEIDTPESFGIPRSHDNSTRVAKFYHPWQNGSTTMHHKLYKQWKGETATSSAWPSGVGTVPSVNTSPRDVSGRYMADFYIDPNPPQGWKNPGEANGSSGALMMQFKENYNDTSGVFHNESHTWLVLETWGVNDRRFILNAGSAARPYPAAPYIDADPYIGKWITIELRLYQHNRLELYIDGVLKTSFTQADWSVGRRYYVPGTQPAGVPNLSTTNVSSVAGWVFGAGYYSDREIEGYVDNAKVLPLSTL